MTLIAEIIRAVEVETGSWRQLDLDVGLPPSLESMPPALNSSFSRDLPSLQLAWDSTSLGALKVCPRYYQLSTILGRVPSEEVNVHLKFGKEFHAAIEHYDHCRARGMDYEIAVRSAVRFAILSTWNFNLHRPWTSGDPYKNRETLLRAVVWYLDQFGPDDPAETVILENGKPAVELSFRFDLEVQSITGENFMLCGHFDKRVRFAGRRYTKDIKTTKSQLGEGYFSRYSPDNQMSLYDIASVVVFPPELDVDESGKPEPYGGLMIDAVQLLITGARFQRGIVTRTPRQRDEFLRDTIAWIRLAEHYAQANYWPMNDKSCMMFSGWNSDLESWHGGCPYRGICGEDPGVRDDILASAFIQRTWDPLVPR